MMLLRGDEKDEDAEEEEQEEEEKEGRMNPCSGSQKIDLESKAGSSST